MMSPRTNRAWLAWLTMLAIGLVAGVLFWAYYRVTTAKFPLVFLNPQLMVFALSGLAFGLLSARRRPTSSWLLELLLAGGLVVFSLATLLFKDASVHFLFFSLYYAFPAPTRSFQIVSGHVLAFLFSPVPFYIMARRYTMVVADDKESIPALWLGAGAGFVIAYFLLPLVGAYILLFAACVPIFFFLDRKTIAIGGALLLVAGGFLMAHPPTAFYTWQLREYKHIDSFWTPFYKLDYITYDDDHCLAAVHNTAFVWAVCDGPERQLLMYKRIAQVLAEEDNPPQRMLNIGRVNGTFPLSVRINNPHIQRLLAVEYDPYMTKDVAGRYAKYNDYLYADKRFAARAEDLRHFIQNHRERYDAIYINGAGIMLFFFPLTFITQEDFLYSAESYKTIFGNMLTENGVLFAERGSHLVREAYEWGGSLPDDVHMRIFWMKATDYPLAGMTLTYMFASRDEAKLDRIAKELAIGNVFKEIPYQPELRKKYFDNRPFMQPGVTLGLMGLTLPFLLLAGLLIRRHQRIAIAELNGSEAVRRRAWLLLAFGVLVAWSWQTTTTLAARTFVGGTPFGFTLGSGLLFAGAFLVMVARRSRWLSSWVAVFGSIALLGIAFFGLYARPFDPAIGAAVPLLVGAALAGLAPRVSINYTNLRFDHLFVLGVLLGIMLFHWVFFFLGFNGIFLAIPLLFFILTLSPAWRRQ